LHAIGEELGVSTTTAWRRLSEVDGTRERMRPRNG
jgi:hypothetical protein